MPQAASYSLHVRRPVRLRRRRWVLPFFKAALFLLLVSGSGYAIHHYAIASPRFQVRHVRVEGAKALSSEEVLRAAHITEDDNLLFLNTTTIASKVEQLPYVRQCAVFRAYPDTLILRLQERSPKAILVVENHAFELDGGGKVLRELSAQLAAGLPLITNVPGLTAVETGQELDSPALKAAIKLWDTLSATPILKELKLSEISAESPDTLRVIFDQIPFEVVWGRGDLPLQAARFYALWKERGPQLTCKEVLDLRFDENIVCR